MQGLVDLLQARGEMDFSEFVNAARAQGLRPELWSRAKRAGLLHTFINDAGVLRIVAGAPVVEG